LLHLGCSQIPCQRQEPSFTLPSTWAPRNAPWRLRRCRLRRRLQHHRSQPNLGLGRHLKSTRYFSRLSQGVRPDSRGWQSCLSLSNLTTGVPPSLPKVARYLQKLSSNLNLLLLRFELQSPLPVAAAITSFRHQTSASTWQTQAYACKPHWVPAQHRQGRPLAHSR
jgi:hypothetical protein